MQEKHQISKERNFRDLGKLPVAGDRRVKEGIFFRSSSPSEFSREELHALEERKPVHMLDFRSTYERSICPCPELPGIRLHNLPGMLDQAGNEVDLSPEASMRNPKMAEYLKAGNMGGYMEEMYRRLPFHNTAYQTMFSLIRDGEVPILFFCTAGKDRTGVAAALILLALGADEETVIGDYLLTNAYIGDRISEKLAAYREQFAQNPAFLAIAKTAMCAERSFMEEALSGIRRQYGTYPAYFRAELSLTEKDLQNMRQRYTEPNAVKTNRTKGTLNL